MATAGRMYHSEFTERNGCGENLAGPWTDDEVIGTEPSFLWYNEVNNYCWAYPGFTMESGHFTQVVWKSS